ncbi:MAG: hypothetical protein IPL62_00370 [Caulobacteraceae bacterium]|nr:hypothetical protein [Caulobacteraceae bacterium]
MLLQFRNITKGWIATIIVGLVGLATVLFLIPQDGLNLVGDNSVATCGQPQYHAAAAHARIGADAPQ